MGGGTIFNVGEQVHVKKSRKFFWFELATVTSQALKYDVINFCQHVWVIILKIWSALNDPYPHNTPSIIHYTDLSI